MCTQLVFYSILCYANSLLCYAYNVIHCLKSVKHVKVKHPKEESS